MSKIKFYYVYVITNNITNKQYVGSHICYKNDINNDGYMGSSKYLDEDYKLYGKENFSKYIIKDGYLDAKDMLNSESHYILEYNTLEPNGYNRFLPNINLGFHMAGVKDSKETKERKSKSHKGKKHSKETKKKMSRSRTGLKRQDETKQKMSATRKEWYKTNEHPLSGIKRPDVSKRKGDKNPMFGTRWITNNKENTRIKYKEEIPEGWKLGRKIKIQ